MSPIQILTRAVDRAKSVFHRMFAQPFAVAVLRRLERKQNKPAMKRLPGESRAAEREEAPQVPNVAGVLLSDGDVPSRIPRGTPVLILVHGIFDRVFGVAFSPLLLWGDLLGSLQRHYGGRVFGFDHETVSVDPLQNARDLLARLPSDTPIDILCHSRGGLVVRALLQHPELQARVRSEFKIRNVIFMGAANQGSPLAEPAHFRDLLGTFAGLFQQRDPADGQTTHFDLLARVGQVLFAPATNLPGISALRPGAG